MGAEASACDLYRAAMTLAHLGTSAATRHHARNDRDGAQHSIHRALADSRSEAIDRGR
jgi:hypothetical protein